jgi:hypothetical protein
MATRLDDPDAAFLAERAVCMREVDDLGNEWDDRDPSMVRADGDTHAILVRLEGRDDRSAKCVCAEATDDRRSRGTEPRSSMYREAALPTLPSVR